MTYLHMCRFLYTIILFAITISSAFAQRDAVYVNAELVPISQAKATYYRTHEKKGELFEVHLFYKDGAKYMDVTCKSVEPLVRHGKYITYDPSGKKIAEGNYVDDRLDGRCAEYFSLSGKPKRVAKYENGLLNGPITKFDSLSGNLIMKCNAINDKLDGKKTIFDAVTGVKKEEGFYVNGILLGPYATFDSISGAKKESGYYNGSDKEGEWLYYYKNANRVKGAGYYRSGYLNGYFASFFFSGNLRFEVLFKGSRPVGRWNFYYDKPGVLNGVIDFEEGIPVGEMRSFDSATGKVIIVGPFVNGMRSGKWTYYYPENGELSGYDVYSEGRLHGDMETFYPSGKKKSWSTYKFGEKYDTHIQYFEDESTKQMEKYTGSTGYSVVTRYDSATHKAIVKGEFNKGKKTGLWYTFFQGTEVVKSKEQYKAGKNDGEVELYYSDGSKKLSGRYDDGKKVGKWNYYYPNSGKDWIKLEYNEDVIIGDIYVYFESGDLKRHEVRKDDKVVSYEGYSEDRKEIPYESLFIEAKYDGDDVSTFIGRELKYPITALMEGKEGKVSVQFIVNEDGSISDAEVIQSLSEDFDKEALRIISVMPAWKPAKIDGVAIKSVKSVPVVFWMNEESQARN